MLSVQERLEEIASGIEVGRVLVFPNDTSELEPVFSEFRETRNVDFRTYSPSKTLRKGVVRRRLDWSILDGLKFDRMDFGCVSFRHSSCVGVQTLHSTNLSGIDACWSDWSESRFSKDTRIASSKFVGANLTKARFAGCNLSGTTFLGVRAEEADFRGANLAGCIFAHSDLYRADFRDARFVNTLFCHASRVTTTNFPYSMSLRQANFWGVGFEGPRPPNNWPKRRPPLSIRSSRWLFDPLHPRRQKLAQFIY